MDKKYQSISKYDGSLTGKMNEYRDSLFGEPRYEGIEYDWEVPDNLVIGSPGGVSTVHHHYTKGFNGRGNTSSDIYAGQGERYNSGIYGNLYQTGQEAGQSQGYYSQAPDYQFWQNEEPSQYAYSNSVSSTWAPSMKEYGYPGAYETSPYGAKKKELEYYQDISEGLYGDDFPVSENYGMSGDDGFDLVEQADTSNENFVNTNKQNVADGIGILRGPQIAPWILFLFFIMAFIAFDFWAQAVHIFISQKFHGGGSPSWQKSAIYAIVVTAVFIFVIWLAGVPITDFESA